jgi:hypothetical protein
MGAGVPLKVTVVVESVVAMLPEVGIVPLTEGEGPMVPPLTSTTSPGAIAVAAPALAPLLKLVTAAGGAILPNRPCN